MRAAREALLLIVLACCIIFPLTPTGCYMLYNAKDGYGDVEAVKNYLKERGVPLVGDELTRRNLGTTRNCEAVFKTNLDEFKKLLADPKTTLEEDGMDKNKKKAYDKTPEARKDSVIPDLLGFSPMYTDSERGDFLRAYKADNLLIYKDNSPPKGWAYARYFIIKSDGRVYLYYAR